MEVDGAIQMKNIKDIPGVSWRLSVLGNEEGLVHMCHVGLDSAGGYCRVPSQVGQFGGCCPHGPEDQAWPAPLPSTQDGSPCSLVIIQPA